MKCVSPPGPRVQACCNKSVHRPDLNIKEISERKNKNQYNTRNMLKLAQFAALADE